MHLKFPPTSLTAGAALGLLALAGCTVNNPPPVAAAPSPSVIVAQPTPTPSSGTVVVQPRAY